MTRAGERVVFADVTTTVVEWVRPSGCASRTAWLPTATVANVGA